MRLAVVIPTYNERDNVRPLLHGLQKVLRRIPHEVVFVDDNSPDGTAALVRSISRRHPSIRVLQRIGRRGLSSACIEGMLSCSADFIAVMDADLQHDETILPQMLEKMECECLDLVVASRHIEGGAIDEGMNKARRLLSNSGKRLSRFFQKHELSDPMSGFFMVRRTYFETIAHRLSGIGFKILLDIFLSRDDARVGEVPYKFRQRQHGSSKLDILVSLEYLELLLDKLLGRFLSVRFMMFSLVGAMGAVLHLLIMKGLRVVDANFVHEQVMATAIVMVVNYSLNNAISYRDRRRHGLRYWTGLVSFFLACSIGMLGNVAIAEQAFRHGISWALSALIGILFGAVWNYGVTSMTTWRAAKQRIETVAEHQRAVPSPTREEVAEIADLTRAA